MTYNTTGTYTNVYTGANGCDSTVTLDLTINSSSSSTLTVNACDSYTWDGVTYDSTGTYTNVYTGANGCDSTVTLDLIINYSSSSTVTVTACDLYIWDGVTYDSTGTYTNVYTGVNSCDSIVQLNLTIINLSSLIQNIDSVLCYAQSNGGGSIIAQGGTSPYSYSWDNGQVGSILQNVSAGSYVCTITDQNSCVTTQTLTVDEPDDLLVTLSKINITCNGLSDGQAFASVTGGTPSYTYLWSNGGNSAAVGSLPLGSYSCAVVDNNGCSVFSDTITITQPTVLTSSVLSVDSVNCNGGSDGSAVVSGFGGTSPYSYSWDNSQVGQQLQSVSAGTYLCTITDSNSCQTTQLVSVNEPTVLVLSILSVDSVSCNGLSDGGASVLASGSTPSYSYQWSNSQTGTQLQNVSSGNYSCTATDYNGCQQTVLVTVKQPDILSAALIQDSVSCYGFSDGGAQAIVSGGTLPYSYNWNNGQSGASLVNVTSGIYACFIVDNNDCQTIASTVNVLEPDSMILISSYTDVTCNSFNNGIINIYPSGGTPPYNYNWSHGDSVFSASNLSPFASYYCLVSDKNNCPDISSDTIFITEPDELKVLESNIFIDSVTCFGYSDGSISFNPIGGTLPYSYLWNTGDTLNNISNIASGIYSCTILDANSCAYNLVDTVFEPSVISPPIVFDNTDTICYNTIPQVFNINQFANGGGGENPYIYEWNIFNASTGVDSIYSYGDSLFINQQLTESVYFYINTYSGYGCGPAVSDSIYVHVFDDFVLGSISQDQTICFGSNTDTLSFIINSTGGGNSYSYYWQYSYNQTDWFDTIVNAEIFHPGNLFDSTYYRAHVSSNFNCGSGFSNSILVSVYDQFNPGQIISGDTICKFEIPNNLSFSNLPSGADGLYTYQWQSKNYGSNLWSNIGLVDSLTNNISFSPGVMIDTTSYRIIVNSSCKTDTTNDVLIVCNPLPNIYPIEGPLDVCNNSTGARYTLSTTPSNYRYEWSTNASSSSFVGTNESKECIINWYSSPGSYNLGVEVRVYETGCTIFYDTIVNLSNNSSPNVTQIIQKPNTNILICDDSTSTIKYLWGLTSKSTGIEYYDFNDTLRYNEYNNIDTVSYRYWVETTFNYISGLIPSCMTRSYFNPPPIPLSTDIFNEENIIFYPNPSSNYVFWSDSRINNIKLFNIEGRVQEIFIDHKSRKIDISKLTPGLYFIRFNIKSSLLTKKLIVK